MLQEHLTISFEGDFVIVDSEGDANENDGSDFPFGKGSGTAAFTSGIGLTTYKISKNS